MAKLYLPVSPDSKICDYPKVLAFQSLLLPRTTSSTHRYLSTVLQSLVNSHEPSSISLESVVINGMYPSQS
jgi:hypothetical protein